MGPVGCSSAARSPPRFAKGGTGTLTLSGNSPVFGPIDVNAGSLVVTAAGALNSAAVDLSVNSSVEFNSSQTVASLSGSVAGAGTALLTLNAAGGPTSTRLTLNQAADTIYDGAFGGNGQFNKSGAGDLMLSKASGSLGSLWVSNGSAVLDGGSTLNLTSQVVGSLQESFLVGWA